MSGWTIRRRSRGFFIWTPRIWRYQLLVRFTFPPSVALHRVLTDRELARLLDKARKGQL